MEKELERPANTTDRRTFLAQLGLVAAASAVIGPLSACSDFHMNIPCLGPALPPAPLPGMTYIRASQIGCALDCEMSSGRNKHTGGQATDDAPRINAALATASQSNPITLIIDGCALISGLFLPQAGYWSIAGLGCGTGFYIKSGTNNDGIHNGPAVWFVDDPGPPVPARGRSVSLSNFTINGNAGDGKTGDSTTGYPQGNLSTGQECYPINLMNLDHINIQNVVVVNSPCYHIRLSNVGYVSISGCVTLSTGPNTDGFHIDGPANDISIANCNFTTGDDAIALNCPEGYSGDISRVTIDNCTFNSPSLLRLDVIPYPNVANRFYIKDVTLNHCSGTSTSAPIQIGDGAGSFPQAVDLLTIADCTFNAPAVFNIWANFGSITVRNVSLTPYYSGHQAPGWALVRTDLVLLAPDSGNYSGGTLSFENCTILRNSDSPACALILQNNSTIAQLQLNGFAVRGPGSSRDKTPELLNVLSGTIGQLVLNQVDSSTIAAPVSPGGFSSIGTVAGAGVLATGWQFPDAVMADGVPYISQSTGRPSIKVDGVVEPYP